VSEERGAIAFAEKVLELLDEGRYTATYKYAVLLALMDLCLERTQGSGAPPEAVETPELAEKIVEIYWPHTAPFGERTPEARVLRQNASGQAEIVSAITRFRSRHAPEAATSWQGRLAAPKRYEALVRSVEWKLIEMPLPRLQRMGAASADFVYEIGWTESIAKRTVDRYADGDVGVFDNRIYLKPGVGEYLLQLNGLLRPLIHRRWCAMVALLNKLEDSRLEEFLFGAERVPTVKVRAGLWEIQDKRCFYCDGRVVDPGKGHVDHFIPWARYPDNGIENLVVADVTCNGDKGSSLAAGEHVTRWAARLSSGGEVTAQLAELAARTGWDRHAERTVSVARGIYLGLPQSARLWLRRKEFVAMDQEAVRRALVPAA
jgi:5-methylcytosine-specific restriction endonuclease McrA